MNDFEKMTQFQFKPSSFECWYISYGQQVFISGTTPSEAHHFAGKCLHAFESMDISGGVGCPNMANILQVRSHLGDVELTNSVDA